MNLVDEYVAHRVLRREFAPSTVANITPTLQQWHRHAGPIDQWTEQAALDWVHNPNLRPNTRKMRRARLRPYTAWLHRTGRLASDIGYDIPVVRVSVMPPRDLPDDQVRRLILACPDTRAVLIVVLMVQCALRCVDLSRVLIEDIDPIRRRLNVRAKGGGGDYTHAVPIPAEAWGLLADYLRAEGRSAGPLIRNTRRLAPTPISANRMSVLVRSWMANAGLKSFPWDGVSAHALRHTCAQRMVDRGAEVRDVQHALGHRNSATTELYLRREPRGLAEAMEGRSYLSAA